MKLTQNAIILAGLTLFISTSCNKESQEMKDENQIRKYLEDNHLQAESTSSGLYYIITVPGSSEHPSVSDHVKISYSGTLLNGEEFDSNPSATFLLSDLIEGMIEGIQLFGKGGEGTLIIPSELAYGNNAQPGIPANSVIIFDIKLIDF